MYEESYEGAAGKSSAGDKAQFKKGSRDAYAKDMYDAMPSMKPNGPANATGKPNTGIQGTSGGNTGNKSENIKVKSNDGAKDYGKGNPYKGSKVKSIADLRKAAKKMGA